MVKEKADNVKQIGGSELKKLQLEILDEIDAYCRKHNIQYFLVGGTLLGAIRHKGYIPWDDDIDISLPRADYDKLLREFKSKSGIIEILSAKNTKSFIYPYAKAVHTDTVLIESDKKHSVGVNIDVFPLDKIPEDKDQQQKLIKKTGFYKNILTIKYLKIRNERNAGKNLLILLARILRIVPDKWIIKRIWALCDSCQGESDYIGNLLGAWGIREITKVSNFEECIEVEFEGKKYLAPIGYDDYLRTLYGNYMELPPENKRVTHHSFVAYWR